ECVPREPTPEQCNFVDDDCDGEVDEGFGVGPLAEATALRIDEYETADCSSCRWAFGTVIAPTDDGFSAMWTLGRSGGNESPNLFGRRLDALGNPTGPIELLRQDFVLNLNRMQALAPPPARGLPVEAVYRVGTSDISGLLFASTSGSTEVVEGTPASGPYNVPLMVWSGQRFIAAWSELDQLHVAVLDANGVLEHEVEVDPLERPAAITLGVYPDRVGVLVSRYVDEPETRDSWFILLDAMGEVLVPARPIDVEYAGWQRLVGTEEGWLHIRPNDWGEPSTKQPLDIDGDPLDGPSMFDDGRHVSDSGGQDIFVPLPDQQEILSVWQPPEGGDMTVEFLDQRGSTRRRWSGPIPAGALEEDYLGDPHVAFGDGRLLVVWHGAAPNDVPNPVYVQPFGCVE
ncbi:MAG: hypothetical protein JNK04_25565, partial [Myxococcales bacterium]|nr:hypothetical protein [Myxococcales bacterium]